MVPFAASVPGESTIRLVRTTAAYYFGRSKVPEQYRRLPDIARFVSDIAHRAMSIKGLRHRQSRIRSETRKER
eukprot:3235654-Rhodomonas_salina.5